MIFYAAGLFRFFLPEFHTAVFLNPDSLPHIPYISRLRCTKNAALCLGPLCR